MTVTGRATLPAPHAAVLAVLRAPQRLAIALPNVDDLDWDADDGSFHATIRPAIALGEMPFRTIWRPRDEPDGALRYRIEGRADEHWLGIDAELSLTETGDTTDVEWSIDMQVSGTIRSAGQRVLSAVVTAQVQRVLDAVGREAVQGQE